MTDLEQQTTVQTPEILERHIPEVLVLDFDRMLGDVDAAMERYCEAADRQGVPTEAIRAARVRIEDDGGTFEPLSYIKPKLSPSEYEQFCADFVDPNGADMLYPDARQFLAMLQNAGVPHIIMTYGANAEWQRLKLRAAGYPTGYTILDGPDKGAQLRALRSTDRAGNPGFFKMYVAAQGSETHFIADTLTFIDDKAIAFKNLPQDPHYKGFWLQRNDKLLRSQTGEVPPNVTIIRSLGELIVNYAGEVVVGTEPAHHSYDQDFSAPQTIPIYLPDCPNIRLLGDAFAQYNSFRKVQQLEYQLSA